MNITAVEGHPVEDFNPDAVRAQIAEAQKVANGSGSEQDIAEAKIELEVRCPFNSRPRNDAPDVSLGPGESAGCPQIKLQSLCISLPGNVDYYLSTRPTASLPAGPDSIKDERVNSVPPDAASWRATAGRHRPFLEHLPHLF